MAKFQAGQMVMAKNGRGSCYEVCKVRTDQWGKEWYLLDNGSVHVKKRAKSGWNWADTVDRGYKEVK